MLWGKFGRVWKTRQYVLSQFVNFFQNSSSAEPSYIIMLQNNTFSVDNRWHYPNNHSKDLHSQLVQISKLQSEWSREYSIKHTKSTFWGINLASWQFIRKEPLCVLYFGLSLRTHFFISSDQAIKKRLYTVSLKQ